MLRSSLPLGRYFSVDVRMHVSFPLLLIGAVAYSISITHAPDRGIALWFTLLLAVLVRELARSIAAAYIGLRLRALVLLPIGGVMAFSSREGAPPAGKPDTRWVALSGPIANFGVGLLLLGFCLALEPSVSLLSQPLLSLQHVLRSLIWMQFLLGAVSLVPTSAIPLRQFFAPKPEPAQPLEKSDGTTPAKSPAIRPVYGVGTLVAVAMVLCGVLISQLYWLIALGASLLIYLQLKNMQTQVNSEGDNILVRDVMLTEYTLLSSSDTLRGALDRTVHSMQTIFPVVRGSRLVGCIGRQTIAEHLITDGDSYLQGSMNRNLPVAQPDEKLRDALRRAATLGASDFVPVVEGNALIGILTSQSLTRAVQQARMTRPQPPVREKHS